jgi:predicted DNA-binding antitoxin AbrB/MazE fold protein
MRAILGVLLLLCVCFCRAETLITKAKIAEVTERGFVLTIGTESVPAEDESQTRFWKGFKPAKKEDFKPGEAVSVRLKTDGAPTILREITDETTADWLTRIRKETMPCTVVKVDPKSIVVRFDNGAEFAYRYSEKSKATLSGATVSVIDLKEGQKIHVKGRLLPTLDTWIVEATDVKPATVAKPSSKTKKPAQPKPLKISSSGKIKGVVDLHQPQFWMVDMYVEKRLIHVTYTASTAIKLEGAKANASAIERGLWAEVLYRRDNYGRLIASEIKLYHGER